MNLHVKFSAPSAAEVDRFRLQPDATKKVAWELFVKPDWLTYFFGVKFGRRHDRTTTPVVQFRLPMLVVSLYHRTYFYTPRRD